MRNVRVFEKKSQVRQVRQRSVICILKRRKDEWLHKLSLSFPAQNFRRLVRQETFPAKGLLSGPELVAGKPLRDFNGKRQALPQTWHPEHQIISIHVRILRHKIPPKKTWTGMPRAFLVLSFTLFFALWLHGILGHWGDGVYHRCHHCHCGSS